MFISHLLATREIKADQSTQANEGGEIEDKKDVLCHVFKSKTPGLNLKMKSLTSGSHGLQQFICRVYSTLSALSTKYFLSQMENQAIKPLVGTKLLL